MPRSLSRFVLAGFMGSGKTTTGRALALRLGWSFVDLDDHVAAREGCGVPALLDLRGEAAFRLAEAAALQNLLLQTNAVIALGGGAPETPEVQSMLLGAPGTAVVYLHAPFEVLYQRCLQQAADPLAARRPLLGERASAEARYDRRLSIYRRVSTFTVNTQDQPAEKVAEDVIQAARERSGV